MHNTNTCTHAHAHIIILPNATLPQSRYVSSRLWQSRYLSRYCLVTLNRRVTLRMTQYIVLDDTYHSLTVIITGWIKPTTRNGMPCMSKMRQKGASYSKGHSPSLRPFVVSAFSLWCHHLPTWTALCHLGNVTTGYAGSQGKVQRQLKKKFREMCR